ncbi:tyrosine-type recombinase/integrase [Ponticaulis profundi]
MARQINKLNVKFVKSDLAPGKYYDGGGLTLVVHETNTKNWVVRTTVRRARRDIGIGSLKYVTLAEARKKRDEIIEIARNGGDPIAERRKSKGIPTFEQGALEFIEEQESSWDNPKHRQQWRNTLKTYCFPVIGSEPLDEIDSAAVRKCIEPIWSTKHETANRTLQRCSKIFNWAVAKGYREKANPCLGLKETLPRLRSQRKHFDAMPWSDVPEFYKQLTNSDAFSASALRFVILSAARSGEVRHALWSEINDNVWTIPAERTKMRKEHRVPITAEMGRILDLQRGLDENLVFPGMRRGRPMSDATMCKYLQSKTTPTMTVHGFRSSFRDWVDEYLQGNGDIAEACLAHSKGNAVIKAYARSDLFDRRMEMMCSWSSFVTSKTV